MFVHVSVSIFRRQIIIRCNQTLHSTLHTTYFQNEQKTKFYSLILMIQKKKNDMTYQIYTEVHMQSHVLWLY